MKFTCPQCSNVFETKSSNRKYCSADCAVLFRYTNANLCAKLTDVQAAYLAGFIDGEGCIGIFATERGTSFLRLTVTNTKRSVLEWCVATAGIGHVGVFTRGSERTKPQWIWTCSSLAAASVLRQIKPYSIVKLAQVELALDFIANQGTMVDARDFSAQEDYRLCMGALNKRGPAMQ